MFGLFSKKGKSAHLGDDNKLYYNEELKRWVERGKEHEVEEETVPPPPLVSANAENVSQQRQDTSDPSSRYVVAGGFGRVPTDTIDNGKFSLAAPTAINAPKTTGFFVPSSVVQTEAMSGQETISPVASPKAKYKGFRIPKFQKPENVEGTQKEYEEQEVKKWKAKIDKREARKQNGVNTSLHENGHQKSGSGKLEDNWLATNGHTENSNSELDMQSFSTVEQIFGVEQSSGMNSVLQTPLEGEPVQLYPVDNGNQVETHRPTSNGELAMEYSGTNAQDTWINNNAIQTLEQEQEEEIDFSTWGQPTEDIVPTNQTSNAEAVLEQTTETVQGSFDENPYNEAEYPGAIRESDDPYDISWLTQTGWTDHEKCRAITVWMCQTYQQNWRNWHKNEPVWDQFWCWFYDGGDEVIFSSIQPPPENQDFTNPVEPQDTFSQTDTQQETAFTQNAPVEEVQEPVYVLEADGEIGRSAEQEQIVQQDVPEMKEEPVQEYLPNQTNSKYLSSSSSSKLAPWEDELLFSIPDLWKEASPSSDDENEPGNLPFTIFSHEGMLKFLKTLDSLLTNSQSHDSNFTPFHQQVAPFNSTTKPNTKSHLG